MHNISINPVSDNLTRSLRDKIDRKTKPLGALGRLEEIALKIGRIQDTESPRLTNPHILVFAADHGITAEGVSAYPSEVTRQMVLNFLNEGAAINVFCRQNGLAIKVVDAGVAGDLPPHPNLIDAKIAYGTKNYLHRPAMSGQECASALQKGREIMRGIHELGCNVAGFGEMGIGNTASAGILMHLITGAPLESCLGRGAGLSDEQLLNKIDVCQKAVAHHGGFDRTPLEILARFGGFEIAMMAGAMLEACTQKMILLVDGFISSSAFLVAHAIEPAVGDYAFFGHRSDEAGHARMLNYLNAEPLLNLGLRLGEGTGAALAYPIVQAAVNFLNEMASFESAGVSEKNE